MPKSLIEYTTWLSERNLRWPSAPKRQPMPAQPYLKPLPGIKAVAYDVYGTLLRIADGELLFQHPQQMRMEVALDKTLQEFNLWNSMSRKPGAPWEYLQQLYLNAYDDLRLAGSGKKGDLTEVDAAKLWRRVLSKMELDKYSYDESLYGDLDQLCEKIAYFFHASLQGTEATAGAVDTLNLLNASGIRQGLLADGQCFTLAQLQRAFELAGSGEPLGQLIDLSLVTLSYQEGVRKPSRSLYQQAVARFQAKGLEPGEVLFVGSRLRDDLAVAKQAGFRTALFAHDKLSLRAAMADLKDPAVKPDRLLTELPQVRDILSL